MSLEGSCLGDVWAATRLHLHPFPEPFLPTGLLLHSNAQEASTPGSPETKETQRALQLCAVDGWETGMQIGGRIYLT